MSMSADEIADRHNAEVRAKKGSNNTAADKVKSYADRLDKLEDEKKAISDDIKDLMTEAKSNGLDTRALKIAVKRKREDVEAKAKRREIEEMTDQYLHALGLLD